MFGKPEWFTQSACCHYMKPASLMGWGYLAVWIVVVALPATLLGVLGKGFPEAVIWLLFSLGALFTDLRGIWRRLQAERDRNLLYISDEEADAGELTTRHFDMKLRG